MADTGAPGYIPLLGDSDPITPIQAPFNAIAKTLNDALALLGYTRYATKADLPATATRGAHAVVFNDTLAWNNGDWIFGANGWQRPLPFATGQARNFNTNASGGLNVTHGLGVVPSTIICTWVGAATASDYTIRISSRSATNFVALIYYNNSLMTSTSAGNGAGFDWVAVP